jgi:hypothetical protein
VVVQADGMAVTQVVEDREAVQLAMQQQQPDQAQQDKALLEAVGQEKVLATQLAAAAAPAVQDCLE